MSRVLYTAALPLLLVVALFGSALRRYFGGQALATSVVRLEDESASVRVVNWGHGKRQMQTGSLLHTFAAIFVLLPVMDANFQSDPRELVEEAVKSWRGPSSDSTEMQLEFISATGAREIISIKWRGDLKLVERKVVWDDGRLEGAVDCVGRDYSFQLVRDDDFSPWKLRSLEFDPKGSAKPVWMGSRMRGYFYFAKHWQQLVGNVALSELVASGKLSFEVDSSGPDDLSLTYQFDEPSDKSTVDEADRFISESGSYFFMTRGSIQLRRANEEWRIVSSSSEGVSNNGATIATQNTTLISDGPLFTFRLQGEQTRDDGHFSSEQTQRLLKVVDQVPESAFLLSAYGLPEPAGARSTRFPWTFVLGAAGLAALLIGLLLRSRKET